MHSIDPEKRFHKYIHVDAVLKHAPTEQTGPVLSWPQHSESVGRLIEHVNRTQSKKWREYAKTNSRRNRGPSRASTA